MSIQTVLTYAVEAAAVVGPLASALEALGEKLGWSKFVAVMQRIEAVTLDIPKLIKGETLKVEVKS